MGSDLRRRAPPGRPGGLTSPLRGSLCASRGGKARGARGDGEPGPGTKQLRPEHPIYYFENTCPSGCLTAHLTDVEPEPQVPQLGGRSVLSGKRGDARRWARGAAESRRRRRGPGVRGPPGGATDATVRPREAARRPLRRSRRPARGSEGRTQGATELWAQRRPGTPSSLASPAYLAQEPAPEPATPAQPSALGTLPPRDCLPPPATGSSSRRHPTTAGQGPLGAHPNLLPLGDPQAPLLQFSPTHPGLAPRPRPEAAPRPQRSGAPPPPSRPAARWAAAPTLPPGSPRRRLF